MLSVWSTSKAGLVNAMLRPFDMWHFPLRQVTAFHSFVIVLVDVNLDHIWISYRSCWLKIFLGLAAILGAGAGSNKAYRGS